MKVCTGLFATVGALAIATAAAAGAPVQVFGGGLAGPNFFPQGGANGAGVNTVIYDDCFVNTGAGASSLDVSEVRVTFFRQANAPALDVEFGVQEMTFDGTALGIGASTTIGTVTIPAQGAAAGNLQLIATPGSPIALALETTSNPGLGGFWVWWHAVGANAANAQQGARTAGAPAIGAAINGFGMFNFQNSGVFQAFFTFGANPSNFMVDVFGELNGFPCEGPAATGTENEVCGEDTNGGCNMTFPAFEPIASGDVIEGTYWADQDLRDTDWYQFTTNDFQNFSADLYTDGPGFAFLVDNNCQAPTVLAVSGFGCPSSMSVECLPAGTYNLVVLMSVFSGFPCGSGAVNEYTVTMTLTSAVCESVCGTGGDCCTAQETPGCSDQFCCDAVCLVDPFCCVNAWDGVCADQASTLCGLKCPGPCEISANDCCVVSTDGSPGCNDAECCTTVCDVDPFCCDTAWDGVCAGEATKLCAICAPVGCELVCDGTPEGEPCGDDTNGGCNTSASSSCCNAQATPGCDDQACQDAVCAVDSFCCTTQWDAVCVDEAEQLCGGLCDVERLFGTISCGETVCGTAWATGDLRDTDWYVLTLTEETEITISIETQITMVIGIVDTIDCETATAIDPFAVADSCGSAEVVVTLPAGEHWVFAGPNTFNGFPCTGDIGINSYKLSISGDCAAGCVPGGDRNGDGCVNGGDITTVLGLWDPTGDLGNGLGQGDANCDGVVGGADITMILGEWLTGPNCP